MNKTNLFDSELIKRYDLAGPRYTSYPTAAQFHDEFGEADYITIAQDTNQGIHSKPLSLYYHIPFCDTVCFYCACNKVVTKNRDKAVHYLEYLKKEIALQSELFDRSRVVQQLHLGGGTPTFFSDAQLETLIHETSKHFELLSNDQGEYSIEIDPREIGEGTIQLLRKLGFNRISLGVQDFDPRVQKAVNRIQPKAQTIAAVEAARQSHFKSISFDLIYGLPLQSADSFSATLDSVIEIAPDRLSIFNYAHLPHMFKPQRRIHEEDLPKPDEKLRMLQLTIEKLIDAGYVYIGMDHFARPNDELAVAQKEGSLYRNFQGYSTHSQCDLIAMGVSAIGRVGDCFAQNVYVLDEYYEKLDNGQFPIKRGYVLNQDDKIRRDVIAELICHFSLDTKNIADKYEISFKEYFAKELEQLEQFQKDGLVTFDGQNIHVSTPGRLLIRNICMVFDFYLQQAGQQRFSKVI